jgi:hydrogenase maturation protease
MTGSEETKTNPKETMLIGIGNDYRSDDSAGLRAARRLKELRLPGVQVIEESGDGTILMNLWKKAESVLVIDTVRSGREPGTIHRIDVQSEILPKEFFRFSTHHFCLADAIQLSRTMNELPRQFVFYGIEGKNFDAGMELSPEISGVLEQFISDIYNEVKQ